MKIGICLVGIGYWGKNYLRVLSELNEQFELLYVVDFSKEAIARFQAKYPNSKFTMDMQEPLEDPEVKAFVIATPASTHFELGKKVLQHGKHALIEKPITTKSEEAQILVDMAKEREVILMVGFTVLFVPAMQKAKDIINSEEFGTPYYMYSTRTNLGIVRDDVGCMWDLAPHDLAVFAYLMDKKVEQVSASGIRYLHKEHEDAAFINLTFENKCVANVHVSWADPQKNRTTTVVGSKMRVNVDDVNILQPLVVTKSGIQNVNYEDYGQNKLITNVGDVILPKLAIAEPLKNQCLHFAECIIEKKKPVASGELGLHVVKVLEKAYASMAQNGAPLKIE